MLTHQAVISESASILEAMKKLDLSATKVLFILQNQKLLAAVSDGDIRRWIISGGDLKAPVSKVANYKPRYLYQEDASSAREFMHKHHIDALPLLSKSDELLDILYIYDNDRNAPRQIGTPVVINAGGKGTRLYPYTKILPKPLIPVGELPIVEHIIHSFVDAGSKKFKMIVNHKKSMIKAYFDDAAKDYTVSFIDEDVPLGTGGGLSLLKGSITETFFFTNCDILVTEEYANILDFHRENRNKITMVCSLRTYTLPYGIVELGNNGEIKEMKEKPEMSFFTNTGLYVLEPEVLDIIPERINIGFPDVMEIVLKEGGRVAAYPVSESQWYDMGQHDTLEKMRQYLEKDANK